MEVKVPSAANLTQLAQLIKESIGNTSNAVREISVMGHNWSKPTGYSGNVGDIWYFEDTGKGVEFLSGLGILWKCYGGGYAVVVFSDTGIYGCMFYYSGTWQVNETYVTTADLEVYAKKTDLPKQQVLTVEAFEALSQKDASTIYYITEG